MAQNSKGAASSLNNLRSSFRQSATDFLAKSYIFSQAANIIVKGVKSILSASASLETLRVKLETVTGSVEAGGKLFDRFKDFAKSSPFGVQDITTAAVQLLQIGTNLHEIELVLTRLTDAAGGDKDIFNRIVTNYTQIMSAGKATAMDIRQFAYMGLPIYKILDDLGVKGVATAQDIKKAFEVMTGEGGLFYKGSEKQSQTITGHVNRLKETWTEFLASFADSTDLDKWFKSFTTHLTSVLNILTSVSEWWDDAKEHPLVKLMSINSLGDIFKMTGWFDVDKEEEMKKNAYRNYKSNKESMSAYERVDILKVLIPYATENAVKKGDIDYESILNKRLGYEREIERLNKIISEETKRYNEQVSNGTQNKRGNTSYDSETRRYENTSLIRIRNAKKGIEEQERKIADLKIYEDYVQPLLDDLKKAQAEIDKIEAEEQYANDLKNARKLILKEYGETAKAKAEETEELIKSLNDYKTKFAKDLSAEEFAMIDTIIAELRAKAGREAEKQRKKDLKENNWWEQLKEDVYKGFMETVPQIMEINKKKKQEQELTPEERKLDASWNGGGKKELTAQTLMYTGFSTLGEATSGTDAGTFFQTYAKTGSWIISVIETVIGGIVKVLMSIEGFEEMLNGVTELFSRFKPILKPLIEYLSYLTDSTYAVFNIIDLFMKILEPFVKLVGKIGQLIAVPARALGLLFTSMLKSFEEVDFFFKDFSEWVDDAFEWLDLGMEKKSQEEEELERLKELNEALSSLAQAIKDQEEYYLKKKMEINSDTYKDKVLNVNDMILTPQGKFSTHPDDYLIATKNPYSLGGGNVVMNVNVTNNASDVVDASVEQRESANGAKELVLMISRKIANDYATGSNGWDSAYNSRVSRMNGRRITT